MTFIGDALKNSANVSDVNATGNVTAQKVGIFAYLSAPEETTTGATGVYTPILGTFVNAPIECFSAATTYTPGIKCDCTLTQYYEIDWHASVSADANGVTFHCAIKKNGTLLDGSVMGTFAKNLNQPYALSGTVVVELAQGDEIQLVAESNDDGGKMNFLHFTTSISEFFD